MKDPDGLAIMRQPRTMLRCTFTALHMHAREHLPTRRVVRLVLVLDDGSKLSMPVPPLAELLTEEAAAQVK